MSGSEDGVGAQKIDCTGCRRASPVPAAEQLDKLQSIIAQNLKDAGASDKVANGAAQLIAGLTAAGVGTVASGGGMVGAATGFNVDAAAVEVPDDLMEALGQDIANAPPRRLLGSLLSVFKQQILHRCQK